MLDAIELEPHLRLDLVASQVVIGHLARNHLAVVQDERLAGCCEQWIAHFHPLRREKNERLSSEQAPRTRLGHGEGRVDQDRHIKIATHNLLEQLRRRSGFDVDLDGRMRAHPAFQQLGDHAHQSCRRRAQPQGTGRQFVV